MAASSTTSTVTQAPERRDILAFRLITKTLGQMEPPVDSPFVNVDSFESFPSRWTSQDRQEVKISDAFAHLAVAEHYVVAIATNRQSVQLAAEEAAKRNEVQQPLPLNILACASLLPVPDPLQKSPETGSDGFLEYYVPLVKTIKQKFQEWKVVVTKNPIATDPHCSAPTIIKLDEPDDFKEVGTLTTYIKNLIEKW